MANSAVVGVLRALLTSDNAQFDTSMRKSAKVADETAKKIGGIGPELAKIAPQAERMLKGFQGDKLLYQANNLTAAVQKLGGAQRLTATEQARVNSTISAALDKYRALGQTAPKAMTDLHAATSKVDSGTKLFGMSVSAAALSMGAFVGTIAVQGIRALIGFGKEAAESAAHIIDLTNKTGLSVETIQRMQFVAEQTGGSIDGMTDAAFKLGVRLSGGSDSVRKAAADLGLEFQHLKDMRPDQQWETVVTALGKVENAQERNRLGVELFGKSFAGIAGSVTEGWGKIASAATTASRAQLEAIDRASDRFDAWVTNTKTGLKQIAGSWLLQADAMEEVRLEWEKLGKTTVGALAMAEMSQEATRRAQLGLLGARKQDIVLTEGQTKASATYVQQLAEIRAELAKLTPAQHREISAARELGGDALKQLEIQYGLTEGALGMLTSGTKSHEKAMKDSAKTAEAAAAAYRGFINMIGEREIEDIERQEAAMKAAALEGLKSDQDLFDARIDRATAANEKLEQEDAAYRDFRNDIGEQEIKDEADRLKEIEKIRKDALDRAMQRVQMFTQAVSNGFADMLVGARNFKEGFLDIWRGIQYAIANILSEILNNFLTKFLGGMIRGVTGAKLGQSLGLAMTGGSAGALGIGGGSAAAGTLAGGNILGTTPAGAAGAGIGTAATIGITGGVAGAALLAWAIWKKGLFRGGWEGKEGNRRRDQHLLQWGPPGTDENSGFHKLAAFLTSKTGEPGGGSIFSAFMSGDKKQFESAQAQIVQLATAAGKNIKSFSLGGFVPPGVVQPAMLHGGAMGELVMPMKALGRMAAQSGRGGGTVVNFNVNIEGMIDATNVRQVFDTHMPNWIRMATILNQGGVNDSLAMAAR